MALLGLFAVGQGEGDRTDHEYAGRADEVSLAFAQSRGLDHEAMLAKDKRDAANKIAGKEKTQAIVYALAGVMFAGGLYLILLGREKDRIA